MAEFTLAGLVGFVALLKLGWYVAVLLLLVGIWRKVQRIPT